MAYEEIKIRILLVEDQVEDVEMFQAMCHQMVYKNELICFPTGMKAVEYLQDLSEQPTKLPHLIILDLGLPGEYGLDILKQIKEMPYCASIPIAIQTGSDKREDITNSYRFGGTVFMKKLFDPNAFNEIIENLIISGQIKK